MDALPLHPKLVHLPIALSVLLPLLSGALLLAWWKDWFPRRTWLLVAAAQALLVVGGLAAMRTGEADEERVEGAVPEAALEAHEEAAELFLQGAGAVLALSLAPLVLRRRRAILLAGLATTAGTLVVLGLGVRVGEAGGELVYRHGAAAALGAPAPAPREGWARVRDDD